MTPLATPVDDGQHVGPWPLDLARDDGAREFARGSVTSDADGVPVTYTVASGDIVDFVAERFDLDGRYLIALNQVRRGATGVLFQGDVLNLSPFTITSVGSINGEVLDEPPPVPMPRQL